MNTHFVSARGAPGLFFLGTTMTGVAYGLIDHSINPASNKFSISSDKFVLF